MFDIFTSEAELKRTCFAYGCENYQIIGRGGTQRRFHRFPNDIDMARRWLVLINRMDFLSQVEKVIKTSKRVCEDHFALSDYRFASRGILKKEALPSLIPVHETLTMCSASKLSLSTMGGGSVTNEATAQKRNISKVVYVKKNPLLQLKVDGQDETEVESAINAHIIPVKRANLTPIDVLNANLPKNIKYSYTITNRPILPKPSTALTAVSINRRQVINANELAQQQQQQKKPTFVIENKSIKFNPQTAIKLDPKRCIPLPFVAANGTTLNQSFGQRPTLLVKRKINKTIRNVTIELIEKTPKLHLGLTADRLEILKTIVCFTAKISLVDLYITLKKLRMNEDFSLLGEYFEYSEAEIQKIFTRTILKLAKYLKFLIRWPEGKKYYDRHKNLPISFRSKLSYVQSLIECVETEVRRPLYPTVDMIECKNFKFILTITPSGIISYISEAYVGNNDDLTIFNACNFRSIIPNYLSLVADPGDNFSFSKKDNIDSDISTDSADEDSQLKSLKIKDFSIPTLRVREPACRLQIRNLIYRLREFKILQPYSVLEPQIYQYINEILVIISALTNLQR